VRHRFSASLPNRRWSLTLVSGTSAVSRSAPIWALLGWWPEPGQRQQLAGPLVVVWDNSSTHVSAAMTGLAAARDWLTIFQLPPYAHELNPVEMGLP